MTAPPRPCESFDNWARRATVEEIESRLAPLDPELAADATRGDYPEMPE